MTTFRVTFKTQLKIYDGAVFAKKLHHRCSTVFNF